MAAVSEEIYLNRKFRGCHKNAFWLHKKIPDNTDPQDAYDDDTGSTQLEEILIKSHQDALRIIQQLSMFCCSKYMGSLHRNFFVQYKLEKYSVKVKSVGKHMTLNRFFKF